MMTPSAAGREDLHHNRFIRERKSILGGLGGICVFVTVVLIVTGFAVGRPGWGGFGLSGFVLLLAGAAFSVGGLLGFLFGVPRDSAGHGGAEKKGSGGVPSNAEGGERAGDAAAGGFVWNSNLVEVSDWLTKILVGVGLTQLLNIPEALKAMGAWLAAGTVPLAATEFANMGNVAAVGTVSIVVFYATMGFVVGHLVTQLWLYRAYSLARQTPGLRSAESVISTVNVPLVKQDGAAAGSPISNPPAPTAEVKKAAGEVLKQSHADLTTPAQYAAYGVALTIGENYAKAIPYLKMAAETEPTNPKHFGDLGRALIGAERYAEAIPPLERAFDLTSGDSAGQQAIVEELMLAGIYASDPSSLKKTIDYGERFARTAFGPSRSDMNRYLACAYGQSFTYNKEKLKFPDDHEVQDSHRKLAWEALDRDLKSLSGSTRESERRFLRSLMEPEPGSAENDLKDFAGFPEFQALLNPPDQPA
jgi:hypothetical protein